MEPLRCFDFVLDAFLDAHVLEFARFEDFAALKAFHEFGVFVAAYNLHAWMFARLLIRWGLGRRRRL